LTASSFDRTGELVAWFLPPTWPRTIKLKEAAETPGGRSISSDNDAIFKAIRAIRRSVRASSTALPEKNSEPQKSFVLHPCSRARMVLDLCSVVLLAYDMFIIPYSLAWGTEGVTLSVFTWISLIFWTVEMCFNVRTGYFESGELEMRPQVVAAHYMWTWFWVDGLTVLSDWGSMLLALTINYVTGVSGVSEFGQMVKASRMMKLLGMLRMSRLGQHLERINDRFFTELLGDLAQILVLLFAILWLNHLLACIWYAIGQMTATDTGVSWLDTMVDSANQIAYSNVPQSFQYTTSLHWAMTQMTPGSMPVQPLNTQERLFNVACLVFGMIVFSSIVSTLSARMTHIRINRNKHTNQIQMVSRYLQERSVNRSLATTVRKQLEDRIWQKRPLVMDDIEPLSLLSQQLRRDLDVEINRGHLMSHAFFRLAARVDGASLNMICTKAKENILLSGDVLFTPGTETDCFFFLRSGMMQYCRLAELSRGRDQEVDVKQGAWLCWASMWTHWITVGTAEAATTCDLMGLDASDILPVLVTSAVLFNIAQDYGQAFHCRLSSAIPPTSQWPDDVVVPVTDHAEIILSLKHDQRVLIGLLALKELKTTPWAARPQYHVRWLEQEVQSGESTLVENANGKIERIVAVVALHLRYRGDLLVQLAVIENGIAEPSVKLVGGKRGEREEPAAAMQRIMAEKLAPFADAIHLDGCSHLVENKESERFQVPTTYHRAVYSGVFEETFVFPDFPLLTFSQPPGDFLPEPEKCFVFGQNSKTCIYSLLAPDVFERLQTSTGEKALRSWLLNVQFEN